MSMPPTSLPSAPAPAPLLTDRAALDRNRARASKGAALRGWDALFLHKDAVAEAQSRLKGVNKTFTAAAVVTPFAPLWQKSIAQSAEGAGGDGGALAHALYLPDAQTLALQPGAHDLIVHGLALHWANDPVGQLIQCQRALKPDGLLMAFVLGGQSLHELRACLAEAEIELTGGLSPRVLPMGEIRDLGNLLQRAGLALPVADSFIRKVRYRDAFHLMHDLRAMGEANAMSARLRKPAPRQLFTRAAELYRARYSDAEGRVTASFEIICLTGWAAHESQPKPLRPGSATHRLAQVLGARS